HVVGLAIGRPFSVELAAIPGRYALLAIGLILGQRHILHAEHLVGPEVRRRGMFDPRDSIRNGRNVGRDVVADAVAAVVTPPRSAAGEDGQCHTAQTQREAAKGPAHGCTGCCSSGFRWRISSGEWSAKRRASCSAT